MIDEHIKALKIAALDMCKGNYSELARQLGVKRATVHSWYQNQSNPAIKNIEVLENFVKNSEKSSEGIGKRPLVVSTTEE